MGGKERLGIEMCTHRRGDGKCLLHQCPVLYSTGEVYRNDPWVARLDVSPTLASTRHHSIAFKKKKKLTALRYERAHCEGNAMEERGLICMWKCINVHISA